MEKTKMSMYGYRSNRSDEGRQLWQGQAGARRVRRSSTGRTEASASSGLARWKPRRTQMTALDEDSAGPVDMYPGGEAAKAISACLDSDQISRSDSFYADRIMMFEKSSSSLNPNDPTLWMKVEEVVEEEEALEAKPKLRFTTSQRLAALEDAEEVTGDQSSEVTGRVNALSLAEKLDQSNANFSIAMSLISDDSNDNETVFTEGSCTLKLSQAEVATLRKESWKVTIAQPKPKVQSDSSTSEKRPGSSGKGGSSKAPSSQSLGFGEVNKSPSGTKFIDKNGFPVSTEFDEAGFPISTGEEKKGSSKLFDEDAKWEGKTTGNVSKIVLKTPKKSGSKHQRGRLDKTIRSPNKERGLSRSNSAESGRSSSSTACTSLSSECTMSSDRVTGHKSSFDRWGDSSLLSRKDSLDQSGHSLAAKGRDPLGSSNHSHQSRSSTRRRRGSMDNSSHSQKSTSSYSSRRSRQPTEEPPTPPRRPTDEPLQVSTGILDEPRRDKPLSQLLRRSQDLREQSLKTDSA